MFTLWYIRKKTHIALFITISCTKPIETMNYWNRTYINFISIQDLNKLRYVYREKYYSCYKKNKESNCELIITEKKSI